MASSIDWEYILICTGNCPEYAFLFLALTSRGIVVMAVNPEYTVCTYMCFSYCLAWFQSNVTHRRYGDSELIFDTSGPGYPCVPGKLCHIWFNTFRPRWNEQHFADDFFKRIFFNENVWISIKISLGFVAKGPINNIPALVQIMAWRRWGDEPLSEPMMVSLPTHICVTQPQWVKQWCFGCQAPSLCLNQCPLLLNGSLGHNSVVYPVYTWYRQRLQPVITFHSENRNENRNCIDECWDRIQMNFWREFNWVWFYQIKGYGFMKSWKA